MIICNCCCYGFSIGPDLEYIKLFVQTRMWRPTWSRLNRDVINSNISHIPCSSHRLKYKFELWIHNIHLSTNPSIPLITWIKRFKFMSWFTSSTNDKVFIPHNMRQLESNLQEQFTNYMWKIDMVRQPKSKIMTKML